MLTEIHLCHACSDHEILRMATPGQVLRRPTLVYALSAASASACVLEVCDLRLSHRRGVSAAQIVDSVSHDGYCHGVAVVAAGQRMPAVLTPTATQ
jgi:hypothetical protein